MTSQLRYPQIHNLEAKYSKSLSPKDLSETDTAVAHHLPTGLRPLCRDLATIIAAWPTLPEAIRACIMALVQAASAGRSGDH